LNLTIAVDKLPYGNCKDTSIDTIASAEPYTVETPNSAVVIILVKSGKVITDKLFTSNPQIVYAKDALTSCDTFLLKHLLMFIIQVTFFKISILFI
jgi:hypothetical protein